MSPNSRVCQRAVPVSPGCGVSGTSSQFVVPNEMPCISIVACLNPPPCGRCRDAAAGDLHRFDVGHPLEVVDILLDARKEMPDADRAAPPISAMARAWSGRPDGPRAVSAPSHANPTPLCATATGVWSLD